MLETPGGHRMWTLEVQQLPTSNRRTVTRNPLFYSAEAAAVEGALEGLQVVAGLGWVVSG